MYSCFAAWTRTETVFYKLKQDRPVNMRRTCKSQRQMTMQYVNESTIHGLRYIYRSGSTVQKCAWAVTICIGFTLVSVQLYYLMLDFFQQPTVTKVSVTYPADGITLPNLTVCTLNRGVKDKIEKLYNFSEPIIEYMNGAFVDAYGTATVNLGYLSALFNLTFDKPGQIGPILQILKNEYVNTIEGYNNRSINNSFNIIKYFKDVSIDCKSLFPDPTCWFENSQIFNCCDLAIQFLAHNGPCFHFPLGFAKVPHTNSTFVQRLPGPVGGFGFQMWYPKSGDLAKSLFNSYHERAIHLFTDPEDAILNRNPVAVAPGRMVHVSVSATLMVRIRKQCEPRLEYFPAYSYHRCQIECMLNATNEACGCVGIGTFTEQTDGLTPKTSRHLTLCDPSQGLECYTKVAYNFSSILVQCRKNRCPSMCDRWDYKSSVTFGKTHHETFEHDTAEYLRLPHRSHLNESHIIVDYYYSDIMYTEIREKNAFTIDMFVSNIGGALGLWTGASIITIIHTICYCFKMVIRGSMEFSRADDKAKGMQKCKTNVIISVYNGREARRNYYSSKKEKSYREISKFIDDSS